MGEKCVACEREFATTRALAQHARDKHSTLKFKCAVCSKAFATGAAALQHTRDAHPVIVGGVYSDTDSDSSSDSVNDAPRHPPFPGAEGRWVRADEFPRNKSFGYFVCACDAWWFSAHAQKKPGGAAWWTLQCKTCKSRVSPSYMWLNSQPKDREQQAGRHRGPHMHALCEACKAGVCSYEE